jgi:ubiquinone/menaquinone biosynthesis C-methylase UbiE
MRDVWSAVSELDPEMQERLADVLETRGADPQQQEMRRAFLADIPFPTNANVLEIGCGTGVLTRTIARLPAIHAIVGVDPATSLLERARALSSDIPNITYQAADGRSLPFGNEAFDVVVFDSTLCHVPEPNRALAEAYRVTRSGGWLAAFDGDYATTTVALSALDPLQQCVETMMSNSLNDRWLVRRLPTMVRIAGFDDVRFRSYGYVESGVGGYMLTIIERGADFLQTSGQIGEETAAALKAEARLRSEQGTFFGFIAYGSVTAQKPSG